MTAILERQVAYFSSDEHIRSETEIWADTPPDDRLAELSEMCKASDPYFEQLEEPQLERLWRLRTLPADTVEILELVRKSSR